MSSGTYNANFNSVTAGNWAYANWDKYSTDFPDFRNMPNSGDCTNFVSQALYHGGMMMHDTWSCHKNNDVYLQPETIAQLNYSWALADPSPWISAVQFARFWLPKCDDHYQYTRKEYTDNHETILYLPIIKGDVIILYKNNSWGVAVASHVMIVSAFDFVKKDFLLAAHTTDRQAHPLLTAISTYDSVQIYCL